MYRCIFFLNMHTKLKRHVVYRTMHQGSRSFALLCTSAVNNYEHNHITRVFNQASSIKLHQRQTSFKQHHFQTQPKPVALDLPIASTQKLINEEQTG